MDVFIGLRFMRCSVGEFTPSNLDNFLDLGAPSEYNAVERMWESSKDACAKLTVDGRK